MTGFGKCSRNDKYQFPNGKPCIFLKLNKIFNWQPDFYNDVNSLPELMPVELKNHITQQINMKIVPSTVWVSCAGENPADEENLGKEILYYSSNDRQGFPGNYFPFVNTPGYLQPIVAVYFKSVTSKFYLKYFQNSYTFLNNHS